MRRPLVVAAAVFAITLASRLPFTADTLWAHDSALYAAALEKGFHVDADLREQRPHPPGHFLYVASAGLARSAGLGTNDALVAVSVLASALAAAALYALARRSAPDRVAVIVALAFAADPLVWQYSEVAYPYTVLALASIAVAAALRWARGRGMRAAAAASVVFAVAAGARQDVVLLCAPLWIWTAWPLGLRGAAVAAASGVAAGMVWLAPTVLLSDGPEAYLAAVTRQAAFVRDAYSVAANGLPAALANAGTTAFALGWGLLAAAPLAAGAAVGLLGRAARWRSLDDEAAFLLLWTAPALVVYVALHIGEWGYVLSVVPALLVLAARALGRIAARGVVRPAVAWAALVVVPAALFLAAPAPFSAAAIARHDRELRSRVEYVRANYAARSTLILTREDYLLVRYYLPEYRASQYDPDPFARGRRRMRASAIDTIVVFTPGLVPERTMDFKRVSCGRGVELVYIPAGPDAVLEFRGERYSVSTAGP